MAANCYVSQSGQLPSTAVSKWYVMRNLQNSTRMCSKAAMALSKLSFPNTKTFSSSGKSSPKISTAATRSISPWTNFMVKRFSELGWGWQLYVWQVALLSTPQRATWFTKPVVQTADWPEVICRHMTALWLNLTVSFMGLLPFRLVLHSVNKLTYHLVLRACLYL